MIAGKQPYPFGSEAGASLIAPSTFFADSSPLRVPLFRPPALTLDHHRPGLFFNWDLPAVAGQCTPTSHARATQGNFKKFCLCFLAAIDFVFAPISHVPLA